MLRENRVGDSLPRDNLPRDSLPYDHMNTRGKLSCPCGPNDNLSRVSVLSLLMVIYSIMTRDKLSQGKLSYPCRFQDNLPHVSALNLEVIYRSIIRGKLSRVNCRTHIAAKTVYTVLLH